MIPLVENVFGTWHEFVEAQCVDWGGVTAVRYDMFLRSIDAVCQNSILSSCLKADDKYPKKYKRILL
jgi:hypothetical protein